MNTLFCQIEELPQALEGFGTRRCPAVSPAVPDPPERSVAFLTRERESVLHIALDALEVKGLLAFPASWKLEHDDLDDFVTAILRQPPPMVSIDAAIPARLEFPHLDGRQLCGPCQPFDVVHADGTDRTGPIDRIGRDLAGFRALDRGTGRWSGPFRPSSRLLRQTPSG